jgi:hypothetical protein
VLVVLASYPPLVKRTKRTNKQTKGERGEKQREGGKGKRNETKKEKERAQNMFDTRTKHASTQMQTNKHCDLQEARSCKLVFRELRMRTKPMKKKKLK